MAVRHGYGKIATDGLVFAYDTGDIVNSYKGEPTTNIIDGGANRANAITGVWQFGNHASSNGSQTANVDFSNTYAKRKNVLRVTNTNGIGYSMINQRMSSNATSGTSYTYSFDYKVLAYDGGTWTPSVGVYGDGYKVPNSSYTGTNYAYQYRPLPDGWIRFVFTYTADYEGRNTYRSNMNTNDTTPFDILFDNFQIEENSHVTPFTTGTRSATQGLLDLTGNRSIDLSNVSFDSNAVMTFDGTSDYIQLPTSLVDNLSTSELTVEAVVYHTAWGGSSSSRPYVANWNTWDATTPNQRGFILRTFTTSQYPSFWYCWGTAYTSITSNIQMNLNQYYHVVGVFKKDNYAKIYVNGIEAGSTTTGTGNNLVYDDSTGTRIGYGTINTGRMVGDLPVIKIYNRALTAGEVKNNYSHYKNRFGI